MSTCVSESSKPKYILYLNIFNIEKDMSLNMIAKIETLGRNYLSFQSFIWQWLWLEADKCSWTDTSKNTSYEMEITSPAFSSLVLLLTFIEHLLHSRCSVVNWGCKTAPHGSYPWDHSLGSCINFWSLPARRQVLDRKRWIQPSRLWSFAGIPHVAACLDCQVSPSQIPTEGRISLIRRKAQSTCWLAVHLYPSSLSSNQRWVNRSELGKERGVLLSASG